MIHVDKNHDAAQLMRRAFPAYTGNKFAVVIRESGMSLVSHWDGGSRDYFEVVSLETGEKRAVPQNGTAFDTFSLDSAPVPANGLAVVEHSISQGKDLGLTLHIHPHNATAMLPAPSFDLSEHEAFVLAATAQLKASYAGKDRFENSRKSYPGALSGHDMTRAQWDAAKSALFALGLLNKAGAITIAGKNTVSARKVNV